MPGMKRKEILKTIVALPAVGAAVASVARVAEAKSSQKAVKYQNTPKNGQDCDDCRFFIAGKSKSAMGACQIVDGKISPKGWCIAFSKK
jgi:hypothetical protein